MSTRYHATCIIIVLAGTLFAAKAKADAGAPTTLDDLKSIVADAAETSQEIKKVNDQLDDLAVRAKALGRRIAAHNANKCTYREGHPEDCAAYNAEQRDLNSQRAALIAEGEEYERKRSSLRSHFGILMARLKVARLLGGLQDWVEHDVIPCSRIANEMIAARCLDAAWERHP